jgi:hypothetical protein
MEGPTESQPRSAKKVFEWGAGTVAVINGHQLKLKAGTMVLIEAAIGTRSAIPTGRFCKR